MGRGLFKLRRLLILAADAVVIFYLLLDGIVAPLVRPVLRWLAGLRLVVRLEGAVAALPPYVILALLAVPVLIAEPAKLYALWLIGKGLFWAGISLMAFAYALSLLIAERIYRAGEVKLETIAWFARLIGWMSGIRDALYAWARATQIWAFSLKLRRRAAELAKLVLHSPNS